MTRRAPLVVLFVALATILTVMLPAVAQDETPTFEPVPCRYQIPETLLEIARVRCGTVNAPLNPDAPDGEQVSLSVVHVSVVDEPLPDPIVFLNGGPGVGLNAYWGAIEAMIGSGLLAQANRDLILFDQRGVGRSEPSLSCLREANATRIVPLINTNMLCSTRLTESGIDLRAFTTVNNAADVDAIRRALGYEAVNLYGHSYGSRLALAVLRYQPQGVRTVLLEGTFPPNARFVALPSYVSNALQKLFDACAADAACTAAYGDLDALFTETYTQLKKQPIANGFDHNVLVRSIYYLLEASRADEPSIIPAFILNAKNGNTRGMARAASIINMEIPPREFVSEGMQTLMNCADEAPFLTEAYFAEVNEGVRPEVLDVFTSSVRGQFIEQCDRWPTVELDAEHYTGVVSDIPTLILNGTFDQITTVENAQLAAESLTNVTLVPFPGWGHWPVGRGNPCGISIYAAFLNDPAKTVDSSCVDETPITFLMP